MGYRQGRQGWAQGGSAASGRVNDILDLKIKELSTLTVSLVPDTWPYNPGRDPGGISSTVWAVAEAQLDPVMASRKD